MRQDRRPRFDSPAELEQAINSPEMAASAKDAQRFLDMERTATMIVGEDTIIDGPQDTP